MTKRVSGPKPPDKGGTSEAGPDQASSSSSVKKMPYKTTVTLELPKWLVFSTAVFVGFISVMMGCYVVYLKTSVPSASQDLIHNVGRQGLELFQQHDRDSDGYLSIEEFEPFIYKLMETNVTGEVYSLPIAEGEEVVTIKAYLEPLRLETMTKDFNEQFGAFDAFANLKTWKSPAMEWMNVGASHFSVFLPQQRDDIVLGEPYKIVEQASSFLDSMMGSSLSSNRYYPPHVAEKFQLIHLLLTMFHPRPFIFSRFAPVGSVAVVRAASEHWFEIYFRIHAEFQLNEPPYHPYWFTPAQFTGRVIMAKDASRVLYFNLFVPNEKRLNVDMEWLNGPRESDMEVDIGYLPLMKLNNTASSLPLPREDMLLKDTYIPEDPGLDTQVAQVDWKSYISAEDAIRLMEVKMYPFKKIPYYNFTEVFKRAEQEQKLVHSILLWGALDDQSC